MCELCCDTGYVESGKQTDTYIIAYAHTPNGNTEAMLTLCVYMFTAVS